LQTEPAHNAQRTAWKQSLSLILSCFEKLFGYEDLYSLENELIIRSILLSVLENSVQNELNELREFLDPENPILQSIPLLPPLREKVFAHFSEKFAQPVLEIGQFDVCVSFVNMMSALVRHKYVFLHVNNSNADQISLKERVSDLAGTCLKRRWQGRLDPHGVTSLLEKYFEGRQVVTALPPLISLLLAVTGGGGDRGADSPKQSDEFGTLNEDTFPSYFVVLFTQLTLFLQNVDLGGPQLATKYAKIDKIAELFRKLLMTAKFKDVAITVVACSLKKGKVFLETFIKRVLPIFKSSLEEQKNEIMGIFKNLQQGTRILHTMCEHGKIAGSTSLLAMAPPLRKVLETFVFKVELLFAGTEYENAFSLGHLKHKDITGNEVSSQTAFQLAKKKKGTKKTSKKKGGATKKGKNKKTQDEEDEDEAEDGDRGEEEEADREIESLEVGDEHGGSEDEGEAGGDDADGDGNGDGNGDGDDEEKNYGSEDIDPQEEKEQRQHTTRSHGGEEEEEDEDIDETVDD